MKTFKAVINHCHVGIFFAQTVLVEAEDKPTALRVIYDHLQEGETKAPDKQGNCERLDGDGYAYVMSLMEVNSFDELKAAMVLLS